MMLLQIDNLLLSTVGAVSIITNRSRPLEYDVKRRQRSDASAYVSSATRPGEWEVIVKCPTAAARDAVLAALDGDPETERRLVGDYGGTPVEAFAAVRRLATQSMGLALTVTFEPTRPVWQAITPATATATISATGSVLAVAGGNTRIAPVVRIKPTTQRATQTATVGWKRRTRYRVTNLSDESWYRLPIRISLGSTTAVVSGGRALASGNDVRVWYEGREVPRTLQGWNTAASYVWVLVPSLAAGKSRVFDIAWSNAAAGTPPTLAYPDLPPFDLANSSNALWRYLVTAGKGGWYLSSGSAPPVSDQEVPGAWRSLITLDNPDNVDDMNQERYWSSAGVYSAPFLATRGVAGSLALRDEGLADGVALHHPFGITSVSAVLIYLNSQHGQSGSVAVGKLVILVRQSGAAGWDTLFEKSSVENAPITIARATYTPAGPVKHLAFAVWPWNEIEVDEKAIVGRKIQVRWSDYVDVGLDSTRISITLEQAETDIYELAMAVSVNPNDGQTVANTIKLGAAAAAPDGNTPRAAVALNEVVVLDGLTRTASVWNSGLTAKVEDIPSYAVRATVTRTVLGVSTEFPASEWVPVRPNPAGVAITVTESPMGTLALTAVTTPAWVP